MVIGAVVAGVTDLTFSVPGYIWVGICIVSTAIYLLLIRLLKDRTGERQNACLFIGSTDNAIMPVLATRISADFRPLLWQLVCDLLAGIFEGDTNVFKCFICLQG